MRVVAALDRLLERDPSVDVRRLKGSDEWRLRVGDWRVRLRLDFESRTVSVVRILPRGRTMNAKRRPLAAGQDPDDQRPPSSRNENRVPN